MDKNHLKIDLLGKTFTIRTNESPEHLSEILQYLKGRIDRISKNLVVQDPIKMGILVAIDLADEVIKLRRALKERSDLSSAETSQIDKITNDLIQRIDRCLTSNTFQD